MKVRKGTLLAAAVAVGLLGSCSQNGRTESSHPGVTRVATYNVQWFSEDAEPGRISHLKSVLAGMSPDIVGFQEIQSERALRQILDGSWEVGMADDPKDQQELAIAVRRPYVLVGTDFLFDTPALDDFFPGRRDVLRAVVQTPAGGTLAV